MESPVLDQWKWQIFALKKWGKTSGSPGRTSVTTKMTRLKSILLKQTTSRMGKKTAIKKQAIPRLARRHLHFQQEVILHSIKYCSRPLIIILTHGSDRRSSLTRAYIYDQLLFVNAQ